MPPLRLVMMGTGSFAEPTFAALVSSPHPVVGLVTQPDRPPGHERSSTRRVGPGLKALAEQHRIPCLQTENINTPEGVCGVRAFQPDLLVVAAFGQILSKEVLGVAPLGGINVHASLLPKYRGAAPVAWAIYHGETRTGVTIIRMSAAVDAGDILAQEALDILPDETAGELESRLAVIGARLAREVIDRLAVGPLHGTRQDKSLATKAPKLTKAHGLIDWGRDPLQVRNHIRAMQPWPTAYTFLHRRGHGPLRLLICRAGRISARPPEQRDRPPGSIWPGGRSQELWVATGGDGALEIVELQPAGKRRMTAAEFLRGHPLAEGDYLGDEQPLAAPCNSPSP
ncbi:MAG: methionyl-tRNA formyltransferase [Gemmataceae bacterium]|nr:methionyl-tRNA formyltransferase [Gemmataceae bacterium]MDW8265292.1 methionyl-tRNA formyltransferase [Gemmataceae bacterium]